MKQFEVLITAEAQNEFDLIYEYYSIISEKVALKIVSSIILGIEQLCYYPLSGPEEQLLRSLKKKHHYLVEGNYKIIFYFTGSIIYVTDIFDTRRNPQKINRDQ